MQVTGKGCEYAVEAIPWNEQGYSQTFNEVKTVVDNYITLVKTVLNY